jgi:hypothetical protein
MLESKGGKKVNDQQKYNYANKFIDLKKTLKDHILQSSFLFSVNV